MPRFLAIDWDPPKLNVLGVQIGKGKARVEQSLGLPLAHDLTTATAAEAGKALKDALGQAGIAAAPVLFSLGRDRVIIKELTIPFVPAHEEPTVVRFQASKEMTDAASDVVLDYALLGTPKAGQSTAVQVVIVRKAIVAAITALCQAAGLKLQGIVPRPFALAGLLDRKTPSTIPLTRGLLAPTGTDAVEFCVYSANKLVWARTLSADPGLAGEVNKNLVLLATHKGDLPELQKIETTGIVGLGELRVPKEPLEPWRDNDTQPANPVPFLAALGLAELAAKSSGLPVNLAAPKEAKPLVDNSARRKKLGIMAAAILVPLVIGALWLNQSRMDTAIKNLIAEKEDLDEKWKLSEQERLDVAALKDWEDSTISWLDEVYDIAARLPHAEGLRIGRFTAKQIQQRQGVRSTAAGHVYIHGFVKAGKEDAKRVSAFLEAMQNDKHIKNIAPDSKANEFTLNYDVLARPAAKYTTALTLPPRQTRSTSTAATPDPNTEIAPLPAQEEEAENE